MSERHHLTRRRLLRCAALVAAAALASACGAISEASRAAGSDGPPRVQPTIAGRQPALVAKIAAESSEQSAETGALREFAALLAERTDGRIKLSVHPANQLGTAEEVMAAFRLGGLGVLVSPATAAAHDGMTVYDLAPLPYLFRDDAHLARVVYGPVGAAWAERHLSATGRLVFGCLPRAPRQCAFRVGAVRRPEDVRGLRLRSPRWSVLAEAWRRWGALQVPVGDGPAALLSSQVDGLDGGADELAELGPTGFERLVLTSHAREPAWAQVGGTLWRALEPATRALWLACWREAVDGLPGSDEQVRRLAETWSERGGRVEQPDPEPWRQPSEPVRQRFAAAVWGPGVYEQVQIA